jgi:uncharacterized protein (TIGR02271 family)
MAKTIVGLFDTASDAEAAVQDLRSNGVDSNKISVVANNAEGRYDASLADGADDQSAADGAGAGAVGGTVVGGALGLLVGAGLLAIPGIGPVLAAGPLAAAIGTTAATVGAGALGAGIGAATGGLLGGLVGAGVPEEDAHIYAEGVRRGGTLVTVDANDNEVDTVVAALERHAPVDVDTRGSEYRATGWSAFDPNSTAYERDQLATERATMQSAAATTDETTLRTGNNRDATVLPVIEEEIEVGKRQTQRGGVRVHTRMVETPVEEQVTLRQEHVNIERRPVDRDLGATEGSAFEERSIEVTERAEEAVVAKKANVVEEIVVSKDVDQRTETVRDTVRRTDVDIEEVGSGGSAGNYANYENDFRTHYTATYGSTQPYDRYAATYRYGYDLSNSERYRGKDWAAIENDVRRDWERQHSDSPWDKAKDAIQYAWNKARGR